MRLILVILVQLLLAFVVSASVMPVLLATIPEVREERTGVIAVIAIFVVSFALIAVVWPARKQQQPGQQADRQ